MKIITKIEQQKKRKNRFSIYINEEYAFGVDKDVLLKCSLTKGLELTDEFLDNIVKSEENNKAFNYALTLLSFRQRSVNELKVKMTQKGYEESIINHSLETLKKYGYINDYEFGKSFINDRQSVKKAGKNLLKRELYQKGVSKELIDSLIEETVDEDGEYERALSLANKKERSFGDKDNYNSKYKKLSGLLARKGFSYDIISKVIKEVLK